MPTTTPTSRTTAPVPPALLEQLQVLRKHSLFTLYGPGGRLRGKAWVKPYYRSMVDPVAELARILRALQVLAQLARTDESAWVRMFLEFWPRYYDPPFWQRLREQQHTGGQPVDRRRDDDTVIGLMVEYSRVTDDRYWNPRDLIDGLRRFSVQNANDQGLVTIIPIHIRMMWLDDVATDVGSIETLAASTAAVSTPSPYQVVSVSGLEECSNWTPDETCLQPIGSLVRCGVMISAFPLFRCDVTPHNAAALVVALHAILPPSSSDDTATTSLDSISLSAGGDNSVKSLDFMTLSLVGDNRSIRELEVECLREPSDRAVRWLAFSLFSACASHNLRTLQTAGYFKTTLIDSFRKVVFARDPVVELFHEHRSSVERHAPTRIQASRFYLYGPSQVVVNCRTFSGLRVITHDHEWWSVLLPGWGRAWVHTGDAVVVSIHVDQSDALGGPRWIREFTVSEFSAETFSWLATVGFGVETLTVLDAQVERVLWSALTAAFPNVTALKLQCVNLDRLAPLHTTGLDDGWTKLQALELRCVSAIDDDIRTHVTKLLSALAKRDHPLTQTLQSLVIEFEDRKLPYKRVLNAALAMLNANKRLRVFALILPKRTKVDADVMRAAFHAHRGMLGEREKLAFLSALSRQRRSASEHFDCHVAAKILRFVGPCFFRHVDFYP